MMGILTCQTPNLPSLSFSSPPPSPRGTGPPLCPCPSQELNSEEHLCKCSVRFHRADFGAPARLWALGLGLLLAAHLGAFPLLMTLSCPAHSVSSCPSQGRATLEVWAGAEGTRAGLLAFLSPWPYSLMSSFSDSGCAQVWFCSSDSDLSGLPYVQEELWHWVMYIKDSQSPKLFVKSIKRKNCNYSEAPTILCRSNAEKNMKKQKKSRLPNRTF